VTRAEIVTRATTTRQITEQENLEGAEESAEEAAEVEGHLRRGPESRLEPGTRTEPGARA
jgi:hypothetical protein